MLDPKAPVALSLADRLDDGPVSNELDAVRVLGWVSEGFGERGPERQDLGLARSIEPALDRPGLRDRDECRRLGRGKVVLVLGLEEGRVGAEREEVLASSDEHDFETH